MFRRFFYPYTSTSPSFLEEGIDKLPSTVNTMSKYPRRSSWVYNLLIALPITLAVAFGLSLWQSDGTILQGGWRQTIGAVNFSNFVSVASAQSCAPGDPAMDIGSTNGAIYYNSCSKKFRIYVDNAWQNLSGYWLMNTRSQLYNTPQSTVVINTFGAPAMSSTYPVTGTSSRDALVLNVNSASDLAAIRLANVRRLGFWSDSLGDWATLVAGRIDAKSVYVCTDPFNRIGCSEMSGGTGSAYWEEMDAETIQNISLHPDVNIINTLTVHNSLFVKDDSTYSGDWQKLDQICGTNNAECTNISAVKDVHVSEDNSTLLFKGGNFLAGTQLRDFVYVYNNTVANRGGYNVSPQGLSYGTYKACINNNYLNKLCATDNDCGYETGACKQQNLNNDSGAVVAYDNHAWIFSPYLITAGDTFISYLERGTNSNWKLNTWQTQKTSSTDNEMQHMPRPMWGYKPKNPVVPGTTSISPAIGDVQYILHTYNGVRDYDSEGDLQGSLFIKDNATYPNFDFVSGTNSSGKVLDTQVATIAQIDAVHDMYGNSFSDGLADIWFAGMITSILHPENTEAAITVCPSKKYSTGSSDSSLFDCTVSGINNLFKPRVDIDFSKDVVPNAMWIDDSGTFLIMVGRQWESNKPNVIFSKNVVRECNNSPAQDGTDCQGLSTRNKTAIEWETVNINANDTIFTKVWGVGSFTAPSDFEIFVSGMTDCTDTRDISTCTRNVLYHATGAVGNFQQAESYTLETPPCEDLSNSSLSCSVNNYWAGVTYYNTETANTTTVVGIAPSLITDPITGTVTAEGLYYRGLSIPKGTLSVAGKAYIGGELQADNNTWGTHETINRGTGLKECGPGNFVTGINFDASGNVTSFRCSKL